MSMSPARRHQINYHIWTDDDVGGAEELLRSWDGRFHKGLVFTPLALALAVPMAVRCDQASICPAVKAGPAFQVQRLQGQERQEGRLLGLGSRLPTCSYLALGLIECLR